MLRSQRVCPEQTQCLGHRMRQASKPKLLGYSTTGSLAVGRPGKRSPHRLQIGLGQLASKHHTLRIFELRFCEHAKPQVLCLFKLALCKRAPRNAKAGRICAMVLSVRFGVQVEACSLAKWTSGRLAQETGTRSKTPTFFSRLLSPRSVS